MGKGEATRQLILQRAFEESVKVGLEGLTIGSLATALKMSKSGLHGHFGNKEELQQQVIDYAADLFVQLVIKPAFAAPRGAARVRNLFENWLQICTNTIDVGCFFASTTAEFDDRPGPVRDRLHTSQTRWMSFVADCFREGVRNGEFRTDFDPDQFAFDLYGIILAYHHAARMMGDDAAEKRAHQSFERLFQDALVASAPAPRPAAPKTAAR